MAGAERRIEPWPVAVAILLLVTIGGSFGFFAIAAAHPDPEIVEDAYAVGLRYNEQLLAAERARARGLELDVATQWRDGALAVEAGIVGRNGEPIASQHAVVRRERPAEGGYDRDFELEPRGERHAGTIPLPLPGRWRLVATLVVDGDPVRKTIPVWRP